MEKSLKIIGNSQSTCGTCSSTGCGTCAPTSPLTKAPATLSWREFGYAALVASAGTLLAGCSEQKPTEQASQAAPPFPPFSPDLPLVQLSKGPIITTLVRRNGDGSPCMFARTRSLHRRMSPTMTGADIGLRPERTTVD
jgi:hypothetical protein